MPGDIERVHQAVLDYAEGWFLGDLARMQRALHPAFSKRRAVEGGTGFETFGPDDVSLFSIKVMDQGEVSTPVRIIFNSFDQTFDTGFLPFEVDQPLGLCQPGFHALPQIG